MTAKEIIRLLAERHAEDVFVPECKDGPTQLSGHLRLDAWAMKKSWANPLVLGYEVKVSRSDFLNDNKWPSYLPLCNAFYFVCPAGLIKPEEVGPSCGLIYVASTGKSLVTKRKAPYREVTIPENVFRYILMCRTRITRPNEPMTREQRLDLWRGWLAEKRESRTLGYNVSKAIREAYDNMRDERDAAVRAASVYEPLKSTLVALGWPEGRHSWISPNAVREKIQGKPEAEPWMARSLRNAEAEIKKLNAALFPEINQ